MPVPMPMPGPMPGPGPGAGVGSGSAGREGGLGVAADQNPPSRHLTKVESLSNIF